MSDPDGNGQEVSVRAATARRTREDGVVAAGAGQPVNTTTQREQHRT